MPSEPAYKSSRDRNLFQTSYLHIYLKNDIIRLKSSIILFSLFNMAI